MTWVKRLLASLRRLIMGESYMTDVSTLAPKYQDALEKFNALGHLIKDEGSLEVKQAYRDAHHALREAVDEATVVFGVAESELTGVAERGPPTEKPEV